MSLGKWSLDRIQFLLQHIEDFIEDESQSIRERAKNFEPQTDLTPLESLVQLAPEQTDRPVEAFENLAPFYEMGLLVQKAPSFESTNWWVTDVFWRGSVFRLKMEDQVAAQAVIPAISPLQVQKTSAHKVLGELKMDFFWPFPDASAFLFKPSQSTAYILITSLAEPWSRGHVEKTHQLINRSFLY